MLCIYLPSVQRATCHTQSVCLNHRTCRASRSTHDSTKQIASCVCVCLTVFLLSHLFTGKPSNGSLVRPSPSRDFTFCSFSKISPALIPLKSFFHTLKSVRGGGGGSVHHEPGVSQCAENNKRKMAVHKKV